MDASVFLPVKEENYITILKNYIKVHKLYYSILSIEETDRLYLHNTEIAQIKPSKHKKYKE